MSMPTDPAAKERLGCSVAAALAGSIDVTSAAHCPVCGRSNACRLETGEAYKGPCWCERLTLSTAAMRRLQADLPEPRCLCRTCLESIAANPEITREELASRRLRGAAPAPDIGDYYLEGTTMVFTEQYHLRRGSCCGSGCRHCPFDAPEEARAGSNPG